MNPLLTNLVKEKGLKFVHVKNRDKRLWASIAYMPKNDTEFYYGLTVVSEEEKNPSRNVGRLNAVSRLLLVEEGGFTNFAVSQVYHNDFLDFLQVDLGLKNGGIINKGEFRRKVFEIKTIAKYALGGECDCEE